MYNNERSKNVKVNVEDDLTLYFNDLKKYKPLKREEERELLHRYKENNDLVARQKLITHNLRYAFSLVNKYKDKGVPMSDLIEEANCGLIESVDNFDISQDVKIITYARWRMEYYMQCAIERQNKIKTEELPEENEKQSYNDSDDDIINTPSSCEQDEEADENDIFSETTAKESVASIIGVLTEREDDFIRMYYGIVPYNKTYTYQEIGNKYGITKERVRQIIDKIMRKLRVEALTKLTE